VGPSLCITGQETQEENLLGGTNPFTGQSLHPSPVQSSRSIQRMKTVQAPRQVLIFHLFLMGPSLGLTDHETQEENLLGGTNPFTGQFYYPIYLLYKAQLIHSAHAESPGSKTSSHFSPFLWDQVSTSQIKKVRSKRICQVEPTLLQVGSYTHLLFKAQDPFSL